MLSADQSRCLSAAALLGLAALAAGTVRADAEFKALDFGDVSVEMPRHWPVTQAPQVQLDRSQAPGSRQTLYAAEAWLQDDAADAFLRLDIEYRQQFSQQEMSDAMSMPKKGIEARMREIEWAAVAAISAQADSRKVEVIRRGIDSSGHVYCFAFTLAVTTPRAARTAYSWACPADNRLVSLSAIHDNADEAAVLPVIRRVRSSLGLPDARSTPVAEETSLPQMLAKKPLSLLDFGIYRLELLAGQLDFSALSTARHTAQVRYPATFARYPSAHPVIGLQVELPLPKLRGTADETCALVVRAMREQLSARVPQPAVLFMHAGDDPAAADSPVSLRLNREIMLAARIVATGKAEFPATRCAGPWPGHEVLPDRAP
ncbi:MAG: hypothetical protein ACOY33_10600 [Pseudomonadota bacterium]